MMDRKPTANNNIYFIGFIPICIGLSIAEDDMLG